MNFSATTVTKRSELVTVATLMLDGDLNLIEGVRKICELRHTAGDPDNEVFLPIRAIASATDHFPLGEVRSRCAAEYIQQLDAEMERYLAGVRHDILAACKEIIRDFS